MNLTSIRGRSWERPLGTAHSTLGRHLWSRHWVIDPHPTCTTSLGPQDPGQVWYCPLHLKGGRGMLEWCPGLLIPSLTTGLHCSTSPLPACSTFQLLPAPPVPSLVPGVLGFVALAHCGLSLGICLLISHRYLVLPSSSWHPWGHLPGVAPATTPQSGSGLQSHGPFCQLSPLPPPSCTEAVWTRLTSRASLPQGCHQRWGAGGGPSQRSWAQPCSSGQRQLGGCEDVLGIPVAGHLVPEPSGSVQGRSEALSGGIRRC